MKRTRMHLWIIGLVLASTAVFAMAAPTPESNIRRDDAGIEPFIKMRWPGMANLAPDGTLYFVHNPDGINQLFKVAPGKTQKDAVQRTTFPDGIGGYDLSEDGKWITITAAIGGSEQFSLHLLDAASGKIDPLFTDPKVVYAGPIWRRDSKAFAYRANDESSADFHVYLFDLETRKHKKAYAGKGHHDAADFNHDGTKLMVSKTISATYAQLFEVDMATGDSREITPKGEKWSFEPVGYSTDDRRFVVNTNYQSDLTAIHTIDLRSGEIKPALSDLSGKEVDFGVLNEDRSVLAVGVNEDGYRTLHLRRASDFTPIAGPELAKGIVGNIAFRGKNMLYSLSHNGRA